ncbi:hypothetical protein PG987_009488 [Apiospora arundinis]
MSIYRVSQLERDYSHNKWEIWDTAMASLRSLTIVVDSLSKLKHPFIMVGQAACYAMNVKWEDPTAVDLLVRASILEKFRDSLLGTGFWTEPASKSSKDGISQRGINRFRRDACVLLKRTDSRGNNCCNYLRLWSEEAYGLKIGGFNSFIPLKVTNQLWEKAGTKDPCNNGRYSITEYIPDMYVPTLPVLLDAIIRNVFRGRRDTPFRYADVSTQLRALIMTNYFEDSPAREMVLANFQEEEWKFDFLSDYFNRVTRPRPAGHKPKQSDVRERHLRVKYLRTAQSASLGPYATPPGCYHDNDGILRPVENYYPQIDVGDGQPEHMPQSPGYDFDSFDYICNPWPDKQESEDKEGDIYLMERLSGFKINGYMGFDLPVLRWLDAVEEEKDYRFIKQVHRDTILEQRPSARPRDPNLGVRIDWARPGNPSHGPWVVDS